MPITTKNRAYFRQYENKVKPLKKHQKPKAICVNIDHLSRVDELEVITAQLTAIRTEIEAALKSANLRIPHQENDHRYKYLSHISNLRDIEIKLMNKLIIQHKNQPPSKLTSNLCKILTEVFTT